MRDQSTSKCFFFHVLHPGLDVNQYIFFYLNIFLIAFYWEKGAPKQLCSELRQWLSSTHVGSCRGDNTNANLIKLIEDVRG